MLPASGVDGGATTPTLDGAAASEAASSGCRTTADCPKGTTCQIPRGCTALGSCEPPPDSCAIFVAPPPPVCGCDGKTYYSDCEARRAGVNVAREGACTIDPSCEGVSCAVINDCCQCAAYDKAKPPVPGPACLINCDVSSCEGKGITQPQAYCLAGMCFLTKGNGTCTADTDCGLVNNCCACMALPAALATIVDNQCAADCAWGQCGFKGIGSVKARCLGGRCRLAF
jgi:hypothetical protein